MSNILDEKEKLELVTTLKTLGFNPKEAAIYLSLLSSGEVGVSSIVADTNLHRQFVYDNLLSLENKGLVGHSIVKGRKKFFSHGLSKLSALFEQKQLAANEFVSRIEKKILPIDIQQFEVYRGQEAFAANEFEILKNASVGSKMYVFGGSGDDEYQENLGKYFHEYDYRRVKKNIEVLYIGSLAQKEFLSKNKDNRSLFNYRLLPSAFSGNLNITIYEDSICFYMFGEPVANFTVRSPQIAKSYADFFMGLWQMSK